MKEEVKILENARQSIVTNLMVGITTEKLQSLQVIPYNGGKLISNGSGAPITTTEIGEWLETYNTMAKGIF